MLSASATAANTNPAKPPATMSVQPRLVVKTSERNGSKAVGGRGP